MTVTEQRPVPDAVAAQHVPTTEDDWIERARAVAAVLATDDGPRERAGRTPTGEVDLLRDSGLTALLAPRAEGGGGMEWPTAYKVVREVAAGDGSIGHMLGYHYMYCWIPRLIGTPEQVTRIEAGTARNRWFLAGAINARDADMVVRDEGDELVFDGFKNFATGVPVSDMTLLEGVVEHTDRHVFALVPTRQPGLQPQGGWDNMGQRLTESGAVRVDGVRVPWSDALGFVDKRFTETPYGSMTVPIGQLVFASFWLGVARGALRRAVDYAHTHGKAWGGYDRIVDEPRVLDVVGDLHAKLWAAEALVDQVAQEALALHHDPAAVSVRDRGEHKIRTAATKIRADEVALEITSRLFEVTGARSTASKYDFDRFWRNVRTHTLHDPVAYQRREIGSFVLGDEIPEPGWYS